MSLCFFVSDLHGKEDRYRKLSKQIIQEKPDIVFIGGDLYPPFNLSGNKYENGFFEGFLIKKFTELKNNLGEDYPEVFIIMGNDDPKSEEIFFLNSEIIGVWNYINSRIIKYKDYTICGYSYIPPSPFIVKDWELYDVSRYVDPGCIHPTEGKRFVEAGLDVEFTTIKKQLQEIFGNINMEKSIFLFHSPPYKTLLDRAALDGMFFEHVPLDVHVGSIAIKEFIEEKKPFVSLHGHIHESSRITGHWSEKINTTFCFNAAFEGDKLALIKFRLNYPEKAQRLILNIIFILLIFP